jgi:protein-tyrosine phosphatase
LLNFASVMTKMTLIQVDPSKQPLVDLHNHLIPAIDDGARTLAEAIECLKALALDGVGTVVATPHLLLPHLPTREAVEKELARHRRAFEILKTAVEQQAGLPELGLGQEIWASSAEMIAPVLGCEGLGLAGTPYLLVEFGFDLQGTHNDVVEEILERGRKIVIAHAERYRFPDGLDPLETAAAWREAGALLQVNTGSFTGYYETSNPEAQPLAWQLLEAGLIDLIATDHHGSRRSRGSPREAYDALVAAGYASEADRLLGTNPASLLAAAGARTE